MKRVFVICLVAIGVAGPATPGRAQFLKNLVNNAMQNRSNKPAANSTTGTSDSASAAAKSANDSAMVAKYMANVTKPKPMTAADSAAVRSFMTGTGGSGMLYEYRVVYDFKKNGKDSILTDTMSQAISDGHNTHVNMDMMGMKMNLLGHATQSKYTVVLYPETRTYLLNTVDTGALNSDRMTYTVTRVGTETVAGYACVHAKLSIVSSGQKTPIVEDIWTSTDVPGYAEMKKLMTVHRMTIKMLDALEKAGCNGFMVKMIMAPIGGGTPNSLSISSNMVLITAARRDFPASMFEIPAGYTPSTMQSMLGNIMATMPQQK